MSGKHGPNRLSNYVEIHSAVMQRLTDQGFVLDDGLAIEPLGDGRIGIEGQIRCAGGVSVTVQKYLRVVHPDDDPWVQTYAYSYNACLEGVGNIFRYCSPHRDHNVFHHKHTYDTFAGDHEGRVAEVEGDWPTLGAVLEELRAWTADHHDKLTW